MRCNDYIDKNSEVIFGSDVQDVKIYTMTRRLLKNTTLKSNAALNVADVLEVNYIVRGTVSEKKVSERILKN